MGHHLSLSSGIHGTKALPKTARSNRSKHQIIYCFGFFEEKFD
jgi:hypothetical protein